MLVVLLVAACSGPDAPEPPGEDEGSTDMPTDPTAPADTELPPDSTAPTDTGTPPAVDPCADPFTGPFDFVSSSVVQTEEDFDFESTGLLAMQQFNNLVGITRTGEVTVIATNIGADVAGIRTLPTGDILVTQQDLARVSRVNVSNGNTVNVVSGVGFPNGLEVGLLDGLAYVSDFSPNGRVMTFDAYPGAGVIGEPTVILNIPYPNGLALSPDEQTLYVATSNDSWGGNGRLAAIDRDPETGAWVPEPRLVFQANQLVDAVTTDVCGNVYVTEYANGRVTRIRPDGTTELIVDLPNVGFEGYCAARFGPGIGDWERTTLYVSNRQAIYAIDIGIEGRHVLAE